MSIVLPMGTIQAESHADLAAAVVFFCVLMAVVTVILGWVSAVGSPSPS